MAAPAEAGRATGLQVVVISPERIVFDGNVETVVAPAWNGYLGILRGHAPLMALLGTGELRVGSGAAAESFHVEGGFLQVVTMWSPC